MNSFSRLTLNRSLLSKFVQESRTVINVRFLYNDQFLAIDKYKEARERTTSRLGSMRENFYNRMRSQLNSSVPSMVFTEDLKTIIHSCEDKQDDLDICVQMMKRFHKQNKELRFGTFVFGPVAMRLFYHLQKSDLMNAIFKDPELEGFFDQLKSYYLYMDMNFKRGNYQEVLNSFKELKMKQIGETRFPREAVVLAMGACFKLNTPETYKFAIDTVTQAREARVEVLRKALLFVVALAINQNKPDVALEIISGVERFNNMAVNNLRIMALAGLGRLDDAFAILRRVTDQDSPVQSKIRGGEICQSSLESLQKAVESTNDQETSHIYEQLCRSLRESNSVTALTVEDLVCKPIEPRAFPRDPDTFNFRERNRFPDAGFRERERQFDNSGDFPRRRRYAGLADQV